MSLPRPTFPASSPFAGIKGRAVPMRLPVERRNLAQREARVSRLMMEFTELPGLMLSLRQASRLMGVDESAGTRILAHLMESGALRRNATKMYVRSDSGTPLV